MPKIPSAALDRDIETSWVIIQAERAKKSLDGCEDACY
jgi:hypothetical protein